jgi:hypothetical protein
MRLIIIFASFFVLGACSIGSESSSPSTSYDPCVVDTCSTEPAFCSAPTITDPVAISGDAFYVKRLPNGNGLGGASGNLPIRFAEVAIVNSSNTVLGCGTTDANGAFSVSIQKNKWQCKGRSKISL